MTFSFETYQVAHTVLSKVMKFVGKHIIPITITTGAGASLLAGKVVYDVATKENTKYDYKGWELYKKDDIYYAHKRYKDNEIIITTLNGFEDLEEKVDFNEDRQI